jgi:AcrR family transcriptional regulator
VGRPREHDEETRAALRVAAEQLFAAHGVEGVSVRALAAEVGTTTRAVYSLFGSRDGLLVDTLGQEAYQLLTNALDAHPETADPVADLIDMAPAVFRRFVLEHPALYRITFQRAVPSFEPGPELLAARRAGVARLRAKIARLDEHRLRRTGTLDGAVIAYQALCEGLANFEIRGATMPMLPEWDSEDSWRAAFAALLRGLTTPS